MNKTTRETPPPASWIQDRDTLFTRAEAAVFLRRSVATLERWAMHGDGPRFAMAGGRALYPLTELRHFAGLDATEAAL